MVSGFGGAAATAVLRYNVDTTSAQGGLRGLARSAGPPLAAVGAVAGALTALTVRATMAGDEIAKMAARTGLSVEEVQELGHAAEQGGSSIGALENGVRRMQRVIVDAEQGLGTAVDTLDQLGITSEDLAGLLPREQLGVFADALAEVDDASTRSALAQQVFGRSGTELIPVLAEGEAGLRAYAAEKQRLGVISAEEARQAEELTDAYQELTAVIATASEDLARVWIPVITEAARETQDFIVGAQILADRVESLGREADEGRGFWSGYGDALQNLPLVGVGIGLLNAAGLVADVGEEARLADEPVVTLAEGVRALRDAELDLAPSTDDATAAIDRQTASVHRFTAALSVLSGIDQGVLFEAGFQTPANLINAGVAFSDVYAPGTPARSGTVRPARTARPSAADRAAVAEAARRDEERNRLLMTAEERLQSLRDEAEGLTAAQVELRGVNESVRAAVEAGDTELRDVYIETGLLLAAQIAEEAEESRESASADTSTTVAAIDRIGARLLRGGSSDRLASLAFEGGGTAGARSAQLYRNYLQQREGGDGDLLNAVEFGNLTLAEQRRLTGSRVVGGGGEQVVVRVEIAGQQFDDAVAQAERRNAEVGA